MSYHVAHVARCWFHIRSIPVMAFHTVIYKLFIGDVWEWKTCLDQGGELQDNHQAHDTHPPSHHCVTKAPLSLLWPLPLLSTCGYGFTIK